MNIDHFGNEKRLLIKRISICLFLVVGIVFFTISNEMVALLLDDTIRIKKIDLNSSIDKTSIYTWVNPYEYKNDLFESVACLGWGFVEDVESDKRVGTTQDLYIVLKGRKNTYITSKAERATDDIHWKLADWKNIPGESNNFTKEFSTITLRDDHYEIHILIEDENGNRWIANTGQSFLKRGVKIKPGSVGEIIDMDVSNDGEGFSREWFGLYDEDDLVTIQGWGVVEGISSDEMEYYVVFEGSNGMSKVLSVPKIFQESLKDEFDGDCRYIGCSTKGSLEYSNLPDTKGNIYVLAQTNDKIYKSGMYNYNILDE